MGKWNAGLLFEFGEELLISVSGALFVPRTRFRISVVASLKTLPCAFKSTLQSLVLILRQSEPSRAKAMKVTVAETMKNAVAFKNMAVSKSSTDTACNTTWQSRALALE